MTNEIRQILVQHGFEFSENFDLDGIRADFAVLAPDGLPRMMIRISQALFYDDEAQSALGHLNWWKDSGNEEFLRDSCLSPLGT